MRRFATLLMTMMALVAMTVPSCANLTRAELAATGFVLPARAQLPLDAQFVDTDGNRAALGTRLAGRPALLLFADYRCETLCGVLLTQVADALTRVSQSAGRDYTLLVLPLDPAQTVSDAAAYRDSRIGGTPLARAAQFLVADADTLGKIERAVGLTVAFDAERKQFAHPAGLVLIDRSGIAVRVLDPFALDQRTLELSLTETGQTVAATLAQRLTLTCYGWNAAVGLYTLRIERILAAACVAFLLVAAGALFGLRRLRPTFRDTPA